MIGITRRIGWLVALAALGCGSSQAGGPAASGAESSETSGGGEESSSGEGASEGSPSAGPTAKAAAPAEGTSALESRSIDMQFDLTLLSDGSPAGMQSGSWSIYEERTLKILGVKDSAIGKLQVAYGRREAKALLGVEKPSFTAGKTYVIDNGSVSGTAGKGVPAKEQSAVESEYGWVGGESPLVAAISGQSVGAKIEPPAAARRALIGELPGIDHEQTKLEAVLKGVDGNTAKLDVTMTSELDGGDMKFTLELSGPASVDLRTGWVKSLALSGKVKALGKIKHKKKGMLESNGKGTAKIERKAEFGGGKS